MLSLFPTLLSWSQISPLIIRLTLGAVFLYWTYQAIASRPLSTQKKVIAFIEFITGALLVIGLWTQGAVIVVIINLVVRLVERVHKKAFLTNGVNYYLILLILAISLLVTGAGIWAIDYAGL